jgi:beta-glucosidase
MNNRFRHRIHVTLILPFLLVALTLVFVFSFVVTAAASSGSDTAPGTAVVDLEACPWMDTSLSSEERAWLLLDASTLEQKMRWLVEPSANNPEQTEFGGGFGVPGYTVPSQVPCTPFIQYTDSPIAIVSRGVTNTTAFPAQIALAATWDEELSRLKGQAQGYESFYKMNNVLLGPGLASGRVPYLGRNSEYLGEDPLLGGLMAAAMIHGLQEGNPEAPVEAVIKHYTANEQELDRRDSSSNMDERTLRQIYTLPYEIAIKEGEPGGVMCAFNQINGDWSCENGTLLNTILKGEIGFEGWVVSDFFGVYNAGPALNNGFDQELVGARIFNPDNLHALLDAGVITEEMIDESAFRIVRAHIEAGLFDHPLPEERLPDVSTPANQAVAQRVAEEGAVLLKNEEGILPLDGSLNTIAVIGPTAAITETNGVNAETACGPSRPGADCSRVETPLDGITARAAMDGINVVFDDGSDLSSVADTAANADIAIVFGYYTQGEGEDMEDLSLDNDGDALVTAVANANPHTIVILQTGGPVLMPWIDDVEGILEVWYAGQEMGPAIAALLWGDVNPSGKLPQTFPASEADLPTAGSEAQYPGIVDENGIRQVDYTEGLQVGYRWYDAQGIEPLFPFGYGLSYTTFEYSNMHVTPRVQEGRNIRVRFGVANTGSMAGSEIAQVYLSLPGGLGEPPKRLVGWIKVTLEPGERQMVTVVIDPDASDHPMSYWDTATNSWVTPTGTYTVHVGSSSRDLMSQAVRVFPRGPRVGH